MNINYEDVKLKTSRVSFIMQAAFEYLVAILVQTTFLAELTGAIGFSDAEIGVLNSIIALGCLFQVLSLFFGKRSVKRFLIFVNVLNQLAFMLLYVIPDTPLPSEIKKLSFIVLILLAYAGLYIGNPKMSFWRYSLVEPTKRGRYNGYMQMVSLVMGTVFSYLMGAVVDHYKGMGQLNTAFRICAITIFVLMLLHTLTLVIIVELPKEKEEKKENSFKNMARLITDKTVLKLMVVFVLYNILQYIAAPFYNTYMLKELQMSHSTVQILNAVLGGAMSFIVAIPIGWIGDKTSFSRMMQLCFVSGLLSSFVVIFATPETGIFCFVLYYVFRSVIFIGALCSLLNMVYDIMPEKDRADAYALCQSVGGVVGFLTTVVMSSLVTYVQTNGNTLLGINAYAQQILSVVAVVISVISMIYLHLVFIRKEKKKE